MVDFYLTVNVLKFQKLVASENIDNTDQTASEEGSLIRVFCFLF